MQAIWSYPTWAGRVVQRQCMSMSYPITSYDTPHAISFLKYISMKQTNLPEKCKRQASDNHWMNGAHFWIEKQTNNDYIAQG